MKFVTPSRLRLARAGRGAWIAGFMLACAAPAAAGDWSIEAFISEKLEVDDNIRLKVDRDSAVLASTSQLKADFIYTMPDGRFNASADVLARTYLDPGVKDTKDGVFPRFDTRFTKRSKLTTFDISANYAFENVSAIDVVDTENVERDALKQSYGTTVSVSRELDARNSVTVVNRLAKTDFDRDAGTDSESVNPSISFRRRLTKRTDGTVRGSLNWQQFDDEESTDRFLYDVSADVTSRLSNRLTAFAGTGITYAETYEDNLGGPDNDRNTTLTNGYSARAGFTYALKTTSVGFNVSYGLQEGTLGDLQNRLNASLSVNQQINDRSSASLVANATAAEQAEAGNSNITYTFSVSPSYSLALTDEWQFRTGYKFALRDGLSGTAYSNNVFVQLSRAFTVMP